MMFTDYYAAELRGRIETEGGQDRYWPQATENNVRFNVGRWGVSGHVLRSAGRPARSRGCKSLAMKV